MSVFYGLGVGPGDPELLTLKAWRIISEAPVIAYPKANGGESLARSCAAPFIPEDIIELAIDLPMRSEREPAQAAYDQAALAIAAHLDAGRDVAFLCEGDPFFYGSFRYLFERLGSAHETVIVPGITSLTACAAQARRPLVARNDVLKVLPAPLDEARLKAEIAGADAVAILKVGPHFEKVRRILRELGLEAHAVVVERATLEDERISCLKDIPVGARPYFSMILVHKGDRAQ